MNKIISTQDRVFMAVLGPSVCGKTVNFQNAEWKHILPKIEQHYIFIQRNATDIHQNGENTWCYV